MSRETTRNLSVRVDPQLLRQLERLRFEASDRGDRRVTTRELVEKALAELVAKKSSTESNARQ